MNAPGGFLAGSIVAKLVMDETGWSAAIKAVDKDMAGMKSKAADLGKQYQTTGKIMVGMGLAIVGALGAMAKKTAEYGSTLHDMSLKTGVSTSVLSAFKLAADKSGSSLEGLGIGFRFLSKNMLGAAAGVKMNQAAFQTLGVSATDAGGKLRPMEDVLLDVAERFAGMEDGAEKSALAIKLFGRSGAELIPFLNLGRAGLNKLTEEARRLGLVMSDVDAAAADELDDAIVALKGSLTGLTLAIGKQLLPQAEGLVKLLTNIVSSFTRTMNAGGQFTSALVGMGANFGTLSIAVGSFYLTLGTLLRGLPLIAGVLKITTKGLVLATTAWTAAGAAVLYYIQTLMELEDAKARGMESDKALWEGQAKTIARLQDAAQVAWEAGGMVNTGFRDQMDAIIKSYGEAGAGLAEAAIKAGKHGPELMAALAVVAEKSRAAFEAAHPPVVKLGTGMSEVAKRIAAVGKGLADLKSMMVDIETAWGANIDKMIADWDRLAGLEIPEISAEDLGANFEEALNAWATQISAIEPGTTEDALAFMGIPSGGELVNAASEKARELTQAIKDGAIDPLKNAFSGLYNDIASGLGDAFEGMLDGTKKFADAFKAIWDSIKKAFFRILGEMVAKFIVGFIQKIILGIGMTLLGAAAGAGGAALGAGIGAVGAGVGGALAGSAAAGGALVTEGGFLMAAPVAAGTAIIASWVIPVTFAAIWLGTLFGRLFGKSAADKWAEQYEKTMRLKYGSGWDWNYGPVTKGMLKAPELPSLPIDYPGPGAIGGGTLKKKTTGTAGTKGTGGSAGTGGDINIVLNVSTLDGEDVVRVVRRKVIPVLREAIRRRDIWIPVGSAGGV